MTRQVLSRALDLGILALTLGYGIVFVLAEVFTKDAGPALETVDVPFTIALLLAFGAQCALATDRGEWLRRDWVDLVIVVFIALPLLRMLRFYRYVPVLLRFVRLARLAAILGEGLRAHLRSYGPGNLYNIMVTAAVVILLGAILVHLAEHGSKEANITSLGEAMWWAVTTVTTVGYGDKFPTTVAGRVVAVGVMLLGIALFGIVTASMSSLFLAQTQEHEVAQLHGELQHLRDEIRALREAVMTRSEGPPA